ncbi:MAG: JAB domain-containing protein [Lachnospiraceae bacterium]|nr:JAB domain-containing protein [Lachnospiraceae bacterium]
MRRYAIKEARIMLCEGQRLYSEEPVSTPAKAVKVLQALMERLDRENVIVVTLDNKLKPIHYHTAAVGGLASAQVDLANIFKAAILDNARSILLMHNHPSGDPTASREDFDLTERVIKAGKILGISCVDHVIIGGAGAWTSLQETTSLFN